jgi:hypothetical protein
MKDEAELYSDLLDASGDRDEVYDVVEEIIEAAFESSAVEIEYKTMNTNLAVGEHTTDPTRFFADSVRVQNLGMNAGAKLNIKGSYYDRVNKMDDLSPKPNLEPRKGATVTVIVQLTLTISQRAIEGEGYVLYRDGRH